MKALHLSVILLALQCTLHFAKAVQIGFGETDYDTLEGEGEVTVLLTKVDTTTENITVRVILATVEEFEALNREFESANAEVEINDPAEYSLDPTGRRDFERSGPIEITFVPSIDSQDQTFVIPIVKDDFNEADESFFVVLEPVDILDPTREITLLEGGVTRVNIRDDDVIELGFERREYTFPEIDLAVDTVFVTNNGAESEQTVEVSSFASSAGFSVEGQDFTIDDTIILTFNPGVERQFVPFSILADDVSEGLEDFNMILSIDNEVSGLRLDLPRATTTIFIEDDDNTTIGFEDMIQVVGEGDGNVEVCVRALAPDEFTVRVIATVVTEDGEAIASEDFQSIGEMFIILSQNGRSMCVEIPIVDDDEPEPDETFRVILERHPTFTSSQIVFNTTSVTVVIRDDDGNPCLDGTHTCDANADCENNEGSFTCTCRDRFTGDGFTCQSIDECTSSIQCHSQAECSIRDSGNRCECNSGFQGNGRVCEDIDECQTNQDDCVQNADCINTVGSFMCQCQDGFEGANCSPVTGRIAAITPGITTTPTVATTSAMATTPTIATTPTVATRRPFPIPSIWRPGLPIRPRPPMRPQPRPRPRPSPRPTVPVAEPESLPPCSSLDNEVDDDDEDTTVTRSTSRRRSSRRRSRRWGKYLWEQYLNKKKGAKSRTSKSRTTGTKSSSTSMCSPAENSRSTSRSTTSNTKSYTKSHTKSYTKSSRKSYTKSSRKSYTKSHTKSYTKSTKKG